MPNDLVSREAVMAAIKYLADLQREFATHYEGRVKELHLVAASAHDEDIATIAALPAAGDERWEKLRASVNAARESWKGSERRDAIWYDDAYSRVLGLMDRLSQPPQEVVLPAAGGEQPRAEVVGEVEAHRLPPPQEAGDEPGK